MIKEQSIEKPAYTLKYNIAFCDICGTELGNPDGFHHESSEVMLVTQLYWEEHTIKEPLYNMNGKRIDLCLNCMKEKVMPLVENTFNIKARTFTEEEV